MTSPRQSRRPIAALAGVVAVSALALPAGASADLTDASVSVSSRGVAVGGGSPPAATPDVLTAGVTYRVVVAGTYSPWGAQLWTDYPNYWKVCGAAETAPVFPTAGVVNGATGNDAAFQFASVARKGCGTNVFPRAGAGLQISTAGGAFTRPAFEGLGSVPATDHVYRFSVVGAGQPLRLRIRDRGTSDNYGNLQVAISSTAAPAVPQGPGGAAGAAAATTPLAPPGGSGVDSASGARKPAAVAPCISRRMTTIHLRSKNIRQRTLTARLSGKGIRSRKLVVKRGAPLLRIPVSLKGLRKARYKITIRFTRTTGKKQTVIRRFRACALAAK